MAKTWARLFAILTLLAWTQWLGAQTDDIEAGFSKPGPAEEQRLRELLAQPVPQGASIDVLRQHFLGKDAAANKLGDGAQREANLREAARLLPDANVKNNLARRLIDSGKVEEGNAFMRQAVAAADAPNGTFYLANIACDLVQQNKNDAARAALKEVTARIKAIEADAKNMAVQRVLLRAASRGDQCLSLLEQRFGRFAQAVRAAQDAELSARKALALFSPEQNPPAKLFIQEDVALRIARKLQAYRAAGHLQDAENTLTEYVRYAREVQLPAPYLSGIYATAGNLRFAQREFAQSEQFIRRSDAVLERLGWEPTRANRTNLARDMFIALAGQKKWPQALQVVEQLDQLAGEDIKLKNQVRYAFDRGVVYMGNQRDAEAAPLFERSARGNRTLYGEHHFFTAQSLGLQGAALWRTGLPDNKAQALPLLKAAVRDYMSPANADFLENIGFRKEQREIVFACYLEAMATLPGQNATEAIGAADWVRGGVVQEALNDAAVRAAASTPALAAIVRQEQDARNEVTGLRHYLAGETGNANSPLPHIAAQVRERIAALEGDRAQLQAGIKASFPDYERLVHPTPPTIQDIARKLEPQQALLMLLPTAQAVYVWAVAADRPATFLRANLTEAQVNALVTRLRQQLDFSTGHKAASDFDGAAGLELYTQLLAPLAATWQGKTQLIVAAGGSLSQLPFGVLHTRPGSGPNEPAPWLIRDTSIAQVPSLSAWLAIKSIGRNASASQAFAGWGDPVFNPKIATTAVDKDALTRSLALTRATALLDLEGLEKTTATPNGLKYADIPTLPDTRRELMAIAAALKANVDNDVFLGSHATRESVLSASKQGLLSNKRVLAFATHGLMAGDLPNLNQPALAMAATGTEGQNPLAPLLTLEDVLTLKLNADWVVLSACNSAAADGKAEEALSGLARGFFYAGSRSLLVTHWAVESESATLLTTATFAHYAGNPQAPKAESLRQAMLKVMQMPRYAHPAYWAPYALVGDGGR